MEERIYQGNIQPEALADYLVQTFHQNYSYTSMYSQNYDTIAQKVGQGDHILVQIARARPWSGRIRGALGVSIVKTQDGVSVSTGQSNWLDLADPSIAGMLIGAVFFPPLLIFPVIRGIRNYTFYQDVWNVIDDYCARYGARPGGVMTDHGVYCPNCGSMNDEGVQNCHTCGAPLNVPQPGQTPLQASQTPAQAGSYPEMVTCPTCGATVSAGKFCSNCAAPLRATPA